MNTKAAQILDSNEIAEIQGTNKDALAYKNNYSDCPVKKLGVGKEFIIGEDDFAKLTGVDIYKNKKLFKLANLEDAKDRNGIGQGKERIEFELLNNFHYKEETFCYFRKSGIEKIISALTFMKYEKVKEVSDIMDKQYRIAEIEYVKKLATGAIKEIESRPKLFTVVIDGKLASKM